jgi:hypothetical protein
MYGNRRFQIVSFLRMGRYVGRQEKTGAEGTSKDCDRGLFSNSHLSSHAFFVDSIEKTYNYDQDDPQKSSPFIFTWIL